MLHGFPQEMTFASPGPPRRLTVALGPFLVGCAMWWIGPEFSLNSDWLTGLFRVVLYAFGHLRILVPLRRAAAGRRDQLAAAGDGGARHRRRPSLSACAHLGASTRSSTSTSRYDASAARRMATSSAIAR